MATQVVVFDLGGVLIELGGTHVLGQLVGEEREEEIWRRWLSCPWVRRFERGRCSTAEFAAGMVREWTLPIAADEFLHTFLSWPRGLYPGAEALVAGLAGRVRRACFSNTNELHWNRQHDAEKLAALFDVVFVSHQMGLVKPDREAFEHVVSELGCPAGEILFLDDNQINVEGALAVGLDAHRVAGIEGAQQVLAARRLYP